MIKKFQQFNESLLDKLVGPSKEEIWRNFDLCDLDELFKQNNYDYDNINIVDFFNFIKEGVKGFQSTGRLDYYIFGKDDDIYFLLDKKTKYFYFNPKIINILKYVYDSNLNELNIEVDYFVGEFLNSHKLKGNAYCSLIKNGKFWKY